MVECVLCGAPVPDGANFCPSCGARRDDRSAAVEERKLATVLFADLVGSTALGDSQDPERTRAILERFYESMAAEVVQAGGTVEKFVGDAVMAAFGAPAALEDHAERALHASLAMQRRLNVLFEGRLSLRIGVNTGEVVVGRAREGSSFVTGDAVNVAARLEQAAEPGEIVAGERTAAIAGTAFEFGERRHIEAKGKEHGVFGVPVLGALGLVRPRGARRGVFVGRSAELELLVASYARAAERRAAHLVTIVGDAGLGKTRLVTEFWRRLDAMSPEPLRRTGRCLAYGHGITYSPLGEVLKEQFSLSDTDSPEVIRRQLGEREILALSLGLDAPQELHPLEARDRLHDEWVELLTQLTKDQPMVMLIEDLHWAEEPLLDLLARLARDVEGPLFVVATARPELLDTRPTWGAGTRNTSQLWLEPLESGDISDLVQTLTTVAMPASLIADLVERAEGNPFFAEELFATVIDRGLIVDEGDRREVSEQSLGLELPDTVQAVVAARIDLLPAKEKSALQAAAVVGRTFWESPVIALLEGLQPDFELLETRDFIRRDRESSLDGDREYVFKHAVTREVAYATVPKSRRGRLHAAFAAWLEQQGGGRDEHAPLLAHHYSTSVRPSEVDLVWAAEPEAAARLKEKASLWLRRAGELAVARYDLDDGIALLRQSAEFEPDELERAKLWREIGRANALGFHGPEFLDAMERSLELTSDSSVQGATYAELAYQTSFRVGMWKKAPDPADVSSWIERALVLTEAGTAARCKALIARSFWSPTGDVAAAQEASAVAEVLEDPDLLAAAYSAESRVTHRAGRHAAALALAERPLQFVDELHDPEQVLEVYEALVPAQSMLGHFEAARDVSVLHAKATERLTPHHRVHGVAVRAELEELCADWHTIRDLRTRIERTVANNLDTPCIRNQRTLLVCALAYRALGDVAESERLEHAAESLGMEGYDLQLSGPRLRLALLKGDDQALARHVEAATDAISRDLYWWSISATVARLDALVQLGDRDRIEVETEPLLAQQGTYVEPFALRALGRVRGDPSLISRALNRFEALGLAWHAEQT